MKFEDALKHIEGAQSAGGDLIVNRDGKNILVGKHVQGMLIVADSDEARAIAVEAGIKVEADSDGHTVQEPDDTHHPEPKTHETEHHDQVNVEDAHTKDKSKK